MRIDLGLILAVALEYIVFIYYSNTLFYRKRSVLFCGSVITLGYLIHFFVCAHGSISINVITFILLNWMSFTMCFHITNKTALFQSILLSILSIAFEVISSYIWELGIDANYLLNTTETESMILTKSEAKRS